MNVSMKKWINLNDMSLRVINCNIGIENWRFIITKIK